VRGSTITMSERASALLDQARDLLLALGRIQANEAFPSIAADGVRRIEWSGSWLDDPYVPRDRRPGLAGDPDPHPSLGPGLGPGAEPGADPGALEQRLRDLTDAFAELVEEFEEEDPVRNANGVQAGSLAFAVVGATAARLRRLAAPVRLPRPGRTRAPAAVRSSRHP